MGELSYYSNPMDLNHLNLFLKLLSVNYVLSDNDVAKISDRLLADDQEFLSLWQRFQDRVILDGVDNFKPFLEDLLL